MVHQEDSLRADSPVVDLQDHVADNHLDQGGIQSSELLVGIDLQGNHHIVHLQDTQDHQDLHIGHVLDHCIQGHHRDNRDHRIQAEGPLLHNCNQVHSQDQVDHQLMVVQTLEVLQDLGVLHQAFHQVEGLGQVEEAGSVGSG